jgi:hypothetical protein
MHTYFPFVPVRDQEWPEEEIYDFNRQIYSIPYNLYDDIPVDHYYHYSYLRIFFIMICLSILIM